MTKTDLIKQAIQDAEAGKSKLKGSSAFGIPSFTGNKIRHLLNNLGAISTSYLEVGLHKAGTFISTLYRNEVRGIGVDNWSQFEQGGESKKLAYKHCKQFLPEEQYQILDKDCWTISPNEFSGIDMFNYDGNHAKELQKKALTYFKPMMADEFIYVCDDFSWDDVNEGTREGIFAAGYTIKYQCQLGIFEQNDGEGYWNGILVALLKK